MTREEWFLQLRNLFLQCGELSIEDLGLEEGDFEGCYQRGLTPEQAEAEYVKSCQVLLGFPNVYE